MTRSLTSIELRCLETAKETVFERRMEGRVFCDGMTRPGEIAAVRAIIRTLYDLPDLLPAVNEGSGSFEERWRRAIDLASPPDEG